MTFSRRQIITATAGMAISHAARSAHASAPANAGVQVTTHEFSRPADGSRPLLLDLYKPSMSNRALPVILFVHGGGFILGDRTTAPDLRRYFASAGFAMASLDYRLAPASRFPAAIEDVRTAIRWLNANAVRLGLDGSRVGLWGTSAGGYLVSMAGVLPPDLYAGTEHRDYSSEVRCVLDGYGPIDFAAQSDQLAGQRLTVEPVKAAVANIPNPRIEAEGTITPEKMALIRSGPEQAFLGAPFASVPDLVIASNPSNYITWHTPPFLIMHGLADTTVPHQQSVDFFHAFARARANATLRLIHGVPHTFFNLPRIDELAGPFAMTNQVSRGGKIGPMQSETGNVFGIAEAFFRRHLR